MTTAPATLAEALAALQGQLPHVGKDQTAKVEKDGRTVYTYKYADLTIITAAIMPVLASLGLSFTASPTMQDGRFVLDYRLLHVGGAQTVGLYPLPTSGTPQDIGKAITYARRYALCAVTGLAPGGDDDDGAASAEQAHHAARKTARNESLRARYDDEGGNEGNLPTPARKPRNTATDADLAAGGRMTRAQKAAHDKLEADTRRQPKRAERARPKEPEPSQWDSDHADYVTGQRAQDIRRELDGADLTEPEDKPGSILPGQHRAIERLLGMLGIPADDRDDRHDAVAMAADLPMGTFTTLSPGEPGAPSCTQAGTAIRELDRQAAEERAKAHA